MKMVQNYTGNRKLKTVNFFKKIWNCGKKFDVGYLFIFLFENG